jgi:hypothetical protein
MGHQSEQGTETLHAYPDLLARPEALLAMRMTQHDADHGKCSGERQPVTHSRTGVYPKKRPHCWGR